MISVKTHYRLQMRRSHTPNRDILSRISNWWELSESEIWCGLSLPARTDSIVSANLTVNKRIKTAYGSVSIGDLSIYTAVLIAIARQQSHPQAGFKWVTLRLVADWKWETKLSNDWVGHPTTLEDLQLAMYFQFRIWYWTETGHVESLIFQVSWLNSS